MNNSKNIAIILASGVSNRILHSLPKQYIKLGNFSALTLNLMKLADHPDIDYILPVINSSHQKYFDLEIAELPEHYKIKLLPNIYGGDRRQDSARNALENIQHLKPDIVFIHDAARPFFDIKLINQMLSMLKNYQAVIPACKVADTIKLVHKDMVIKNTIERENLYKAQTPQSFSYSVILDAYQNCKNENYTDDAEVCEKMGIKINIIDSHDDNFKITTDQDLMRAKLIMQENYEDRNYEYRIGQGFDAHRFADSPTKKGEIILGGIKIAHSHNLLAHSDGDVVLHALTDALLGSIAAGDIGSHFPPTEPKWKGASSDQFVKHALNLVKERSGIVINVDITIICESPKIGPIREKIQNNIAIILELDPSRVSVKATTTEKMGFTGRREGIGVQAIANVKLFM